MTQMNLPPHIIALGQLLERAGHRWQVVGGCVRDWLLGLDPKDYDLCTSATPKQMMQIFSKFRQVHDGLKHGTITVIVDHVPVEITTYRTEGTYSDSRHPDFVNFTDDLREDLKRRDFTINAMAYHPMQGLTDLFGGRADLQNKTLRCVGDPSLRFEEDALRILRGLRFAGRFNLNIEKNTKAAMKWHFGRLGAIAGERIYTELEHMIEGAHCPSIWAQFGEELASLFSPLDVDAFQEGFVGAPSQVIFAALLVNNVPERIEKTLARMRFPKKETRHICQLVQQRERNLSTCHDVATLLGESGEDFADHLARLQCLFGTADIPYQLAKAQIVSRGIPTDLKALNVSGADLLAMGIPSGELMGKCLKALLELARTEQIQNNKKDLCRAAKMWYDDY